MSSFPVCSSVAVLIYRVKWLCFLPPPPSLHSHSPTGLNIGPRLLYLTDSGVSCMHMLVYMICQLALQRKSYGLHRKSSVRQGR
jgi:hypothetical protein